MRYKVNHILLCVASCFHAFPCRSLEHGLLNQHFLRCRQGLSKLCWAFSVNLPFLPIKLKNLWTLSRYLPNMTTKTKIVRALWLAERSVCMRVCKHGCDVKMFCFSRANHSSTNLEKFLSSKFDKFTLFTHSFRQLKLGTSLQTSCVNFVFA